MQIVEPSIEQNWKALAPGYVLLSIGALCSAAMTALGLGIGAWTGIDDKTPVGFALFWVLASLALPSFLLSIFSKRMPSWIFGLLFLADGVSLGWANLTGCTHFPCTTSSSIMIVLSGFRLPLIWVWMILAFTSVFARSIIGKLPPPTHPA